MSRSNRTVIASVVLVTMALVAVACSSSKPSSASSATTAPVAASQAAVVTGPTSTATASDGKVSLTTLSAPAPYLSGTTVLIEVRAAALRVSTPSALVVRLNGVTVPSMVGASPHDRDANGASRRLVTGVKLGANTLSASVSGSTATLKLTGHSIQGPVFSGPRQTPFACSTAGAGLGPSSPPDCAATTKVSWEYVSTEGSVKPLADPATRPADIATGAMGRPAYVYDEKGVIDRSIYEIAVPASDTADMPHSGLDLGRWNQRLVYRYGGGCGTSYSQGSDFAGVADPKLLSLGYAVTTSTLNTFQTACNAMLSAEVTLMVKQHFTDTFGVPAFTIGDGGSGGSIQQLQVAQNYPGLLDGLSPELPFPDAISISGGVSDCTLLDHYYQGGGASLTSAQRAAINGHAVAGTCDLWQASFGREVRADSCGSTVPADQVFNAATNPKGVRCTLQDGNVNQLGVDPATGYAYRPLDNIGIQYGLAALNAGTITVDQFLGLNQGVGGYDANGNRIAARTQGAIQAFATAYRTGGVDEGGALWNVPIILTNPYDDFVGDIHDSFRKFSIRDRLTRPDGTSDPNLLIWTVPGPTSSGALDAQLTGALNDVAGQIVLLDQWLTAARADPTRASAGAKLAAARPAKAVDTCTTPDGTVVTGPSTYTGSNACTKAYPVHGDPRTAAGAPQRNDVLKCQLEPTSQATYRVPLTSAQRQRLAQIFPSGVCQWSKPSVGYQPTAGPWLSYGT